MSSAWVRLSTSILTDPDVATLTDGAFRAWVNGLAYSGANLTDGLIDPRALKMLAVKPRALAELVEVGLWQPTDPATPGGGVIIRNYLAHQRSRAQVDADRTAARRRQARKRRPATLWDATDEGAA
jgi:hypothetical protein